MLMHFIYILILAYLRERKVKTRKILKYSDRTNMLIIPITLIDLKKKIVQREMFICCYMFSLSIFFGY